MCPIYLWSFFPECSKHNAENQCHCNHAHADECKDVFWPVADPSFVGVVFYRWGYPVIDSVEGAGVGGRIDVVVFVVCVQCG